MTADPRNPTDPRAGGIELRLANDDDLPAVLAMNNRAVPAVNAHTADSLATLVDEATELVIADDHGQLAGFLLLLDGPGRNYDSLNYLWFSEHYDSFYYVDRIVVGENHRGAGIGRKLYEWAIENGAGRYPVLCAEVNIKPRNEGSLRFHDSMRFAAVGEQDTEGGSKRVVLLARDLPATQ